MGNKHGCHCLPCVKHSAKRRHFRDNISTPYEPNPGGNIHDNEEIPHDLQHISDREQVVEEYTLDPSLHPSPSTLFIAKCEIEDAIFQKRCNHHMNHKKSSLSRKYSSCSTVFLDDSTISQPNLKTTIKCVSLAIVYHIKNRDSNREMDIFDEKSHPLSKTPVPSDYNITNPEHRHIYRFIRMLFNAAQLTAECAIVTLVYLERLLINAEIDITPGNWKRIVLGAILLGSKVWDDQAVWNVDYCQILRDLTVEDMNEMERQFLEMLQFNINVPSSVYAKYYFDLRILADAYDLSIPLELLSKERAKKLEAFSKTIEMNLSAINKRSLFRYPSAGTLLTRPSFDNAVIS